MIYIPTLGLCTHVHLHHFCLLHLMSSTFFLLYHHNDIIVIIIIIITFSLALSSSDSF